MKYRYFNFEVFFVDFNLLTIISWCKFLTFVCVSESVLLLALFISTVSGSRCFFNYLYFGIIFNTGIKLD